LLNFIFSVLERNKSLSCCEIWGFHIDVTIPLTQWYCVRYQETWIFFYGYFYVHTLHID
jgi:hypothetical protein